MSKIFHTILATLFFIILLLTTYWAHVNYFKVNVVFYSALSDGLFATICAAFTLFLYKSFRIFNKFEKMLLVIIWLFVGYIFAISIPTVIDRSLSFYILEKIHQRGGGIELSRFEEILTKEFVKEHRLVDVRLTEQQESGTIEIVNGCVKITERGKTLVEFSQAFRKNLLPKRRLLMGSYSEDLTNPFRDSDNISSYKCH